MAEVMTMNRSMTLHGAEHNMKVDSASIPTSTSISSLPSRLLDLPFEIRELIYTEVFTPSPLTILVTARPNASRYHTGHYTPSTQTKPSIPTSILYTNRQIYHEAHPIFTKQLHLHISIDPPPHCSFILPDQPDLLEHLPNRMLKQLRQATYHFPLPATWGSLTQDRPVQTPFPFKSTPSLTRFAIRKQFHVNLDMLLFEDSTGPDGKVKTKRMTRDVYESMDNESKMAVWGKTGLLDAPALLTTIGRFGCGGWVSALLMPETYGARFGKKRVPSTETDSDSDGDIDVEAITQEVREKLGVPPSCEIVAEADITLFAGQNWGPAHIETMVVEIDIERRESIDVRFHSCGKCPEGGSKRFNCDGRGGA